MEVIGPDKMILLPAKEGTCPECATKHNPEQPHNQRSLYYQTKFYMENGRYPTWKDAMEHCSEEVKAWWIVQLKEHGIEVEI
jgi:hypothetical protein